MFDYRGALNEGYTDEEIFGFLKKDRTDFDFDGALNEGYTLAQINEHISQLDRQPPPVSSLGQSAPITVNRPKNVAEPSVTQVPETMLMDEAAVTPAKTPSPAKAFVSGVGDMAAGLTQVVASDLTTPLRGATMEMDEPQRVMYDYGKKVVESGKKPKTFYERVSSDFYNEKNLRIAKDAKSTETGEFLNKVAENLRNKPEDERKNIEDAQFWLKQPAAALPQNWGRTAAAAATVAAESGAMTALAMVPFAGQAAMVGTEAGSWIDEARESGVDDPEIINNYSKLYGLISGGVEAVGGEILTAPVKGLGGKITKKIASKAVSDQVKKNLAKKILNSSFEGLGNIAIGALGEGGEEYSQSYISDVLKYKALLESAQKNPDKAEQYIAAAGQINLKPTAKERLNAAYFGAIAGGFTRGALGAAGKTITTAAAAGKKPEVTPVVETPAAPEPTGKLLSSFGLTEDQYYAKPDEERTKIFDQLTDPERERILNNQPAEQVKPPDSAKAQEPPQPSEEPADIEAKDPEYQNRIRDLAKTLKAAKDKKLVNDVVESMTSDEAKDVLRASRGIPAVDVSKIPQEELEQAVAYGKEGKDLGGRKFKGGALPEVEGKDRTLLLDKNDDLEKIGPEIEKQVEGVKFGGATPGVATPGKTVRPTMTFRDEYTGSNIEISKEGGVDELKKAVEAKRTADPEAVAKTIGGKLGLEYVDKTPVMSVAGGVGKYDTEYIYKFKDKAGNTVPIQKGDTVEKLKTYLERKAANEQQMQQAGKKTETEITPPEPRAEAEGVQSVPVEPPPAPSKIKLQTRALDVILNRYIKNGTTEGGNATELHRNVTDLVKRADPIDLAEAAGITVDEAKAAAQDLIANKNTDVSKKVREAFAPNLLYGQSVDEILSSIKKPEVEQQAIDFEALKKQVEEEPWNVTAQQQELLLDYEKKNAPKESAEPQQATKEKYDPKVMGYIMDAITAEYPKTHSPGLRAKVKIFADKNKPTTKELVDFANKHTPRVKDRIPHMPDEKPVAKKEELKQKEVHNVISEEDKKGFSVGSRIKIKNGDNGEVYGFERGAFSKDVLARIRTDRSGRNQFHIVDINDIEPELSKKDQAKKLFLEKQKSRKEKEPTAEEKIALEKEKSGDALRRAQDALDRLGKSFEQRDPNTLYSIGTEQAEIAFEAVSALIEAGYHEFKALSIKVAEMAKEYIKVKGFRDAIEDAFDAYTEVDTKIPKRKIGIDEAVKTEEKAPETKAVVSVKENLIKSLADVFSSGKGLKNTRELLDYADKAYGGTVAEGKYGIRDAYDALEAAFNAHLENHDLSPDAKDNIKFYNEQMKLLPTQTVRTESQVELQQFSTPPSEAYLVSLLAGIKKGMTALEPSAGDGSIAVQARMQGATVAVNEIDKGRQENLRVLKFEPTGVDAEYLNSTLPNVNPDVVVMNPPFSATGGRLKAHNTEFGAEHVYQALLRLKPGGRLVAIVGNGMALGKPKMASWWNNILSGYTLRANVGISGSEYVKYGTGFDNNIIVIDKTGPTQRTGGMPSSVITGEGLTVEQAYDRMKSLTEEDVNGRIQAANAGKSQKVDNGANGKSDNEKPVVGNDNINPVGRGRGATTTKGSGTKRAPVAGMDKLSDRLPGSAGGSGLSAPNGSGKAITESTGKSDNGAGKENDTGAGQPRGELNRTDEVAIQEESGGVYAKYRVSKASYKGSKEHPAKVSESVAMASVKPPDVTYKLHLPQSLIDGGAVSDVQLEAITYACQAHEQMLPTGQRKEFLLGDGTGMGKARTLIGIIQENWIQGRKKVVYITKSSDLVNQLKADMEAMGVKIPVIEQGKFKQDDSIEESNGILFTTYSTASGEFKTSKKRYRQILNWFGKDNDGVFIFDESHLMKNVSESKFEFGGETKDLKEGADRGMMGVSFKNDLKNARFVNASATAATTPVNLAYLSRLGLWGPGTPFKDFIAFLNVMKDGGTGAMELLSRDLKSNGLYLSRSISFDGVEYETVTHDLSESEVTTYNNMADFWAMMLQKIDEAAKNAHMKGEKQKIMKQFYSSQQRFFLQLMMNFQAESMVKDADAQLEDGKSVVISLYNTNESQTNKKINEAIANGDDLDAIEFSPKDSMKTMLENNFPIIQYEEFTDENGTKGTRQVMDANGEPLINKENYDAQQELIEKISTLVIPENPIDKLVNHFGVENIAEITGRKNRLVINSTGHREYKARGSKDVPQKKINQHEREAFMAGKKRVAIISGAAATGFDLHSSLRSKNQERRVFYAMQLSWSADEQMQAFGRVHRTMQKSEPIIKLMKTNIASQMRLVNTIQSRLASLGAMTKGGREALSGGIFTTEDITDQYGQAALRSTYNDVSNAILKRMNILDKEGGVKQSAMGNVDGFLNRIMVLPIKDQNEIFNNFYVRYQSNVEEAKNNGTYDEGIRKIAGENVRVVGEETLHKDEVSGVETKLVHVEAEMPVYKEEFDATAERINRTSIRGHIPVINAKSKRGYIANKMPDGSYHIYGPRGFHKVVEYQEYYDSYKTEKEDIVKQKWQEEYDRIPTTETKKTVLVTGSIFPVYGKVFDEKDTSSKKVKRAVLENGDSVIGIEVSQNKIPKIKQNFGIGSDLYTASAKEILDLINADSIIELDNGWRISLSRVMGEKRIEVKPGSSLPTANELSESGMFGEIIAYTKRYFIPTDQDKAETALKSILKYHKAVRDRSAGELKASTKKAPMVFESVDKLFNITEERAPRADRTPVDQTPTVEEIIIQAAMYANYDIDPTFGAVKVVNGDKKLTASLEESTGKKIVWLDIDDNQIQKDLGHTFNGFMFRGSKNPYLKDKIFINKNTDKPAEWIAYHEFTHFVQQNPEYEAAFWDAAKLTTKGKELVLRKGREETMADIAGEMMADPKFWESLSENKSIFRALIDELIKIYDRIISAFKGKKGSQYEAILENAQTVRETLQGIMRDYSEGSTGEGMAADPKEKSDPFFSPLLKAVQNLKQQKGTGEQFFNMLTKTPGVKEAEWKWMGLDDFLKGKQSVTRQEVEDFVRENQVQVEEVEKGDRKNKAIKPFDEISGRLRLLPIPKEVYDKYDLHKRDDIVKKVYDEIKNGNITGHQTFDTNVENIVYGFPEKSETEYSQYQLPGGENYREVLLTLPRKVKVSPIDTSKWKATKQDKGGAFGSIFMPVYDVTDQDGLKVGEISAESEKEALEKAIDAQTRGNNVRYEVHKGIGKDEFRSSHWSEPNVIAHIRMNDREVNGEKVLFIEEIQSDWAREAREKGVEGKGNVENWAAEKIEDGGVERYRIVDENGRRRGNFAEYVIRGNETIQDMIRRVAEDETTSPGVSAQPFLKNWEELTLKRILRLAAEEGYDRVAWISGAQTADRYDLSKQVDGIEVNKIEVSENKKGWHYRAFKEDESGFQGGGVVEGIAKDENELAAAIGKDAARKSIENITEQLESGSFKGDPYKFELRGNDLKIGGEWASALYDRMIPKFYEKYGKKWGTKVENVNLGIKIGDESKNLVRLFDQGGGVYAVRYYDGEFEAANLTKKEAEEMVEFINNKPIETKTVQQQSIPITPEMASSVLYEGQPLFSKVDQTQTEAFKKWFAGSKVVDENGEPLVVYHGTGRGFTIYYQIDDIQRKRAALKRKLGKLKDETLDERLRLTEDIARLDVMNRDAVLAAIYQYAENIGLRGEAYSMVDRIMKTSKGKTGLLRAVEIMDNTLERRQHTRFFKAAETAIADAYTYLNRIAGKTRATTDLETNRALRDYLAQITGGTEEEKRQADMMVRYYNEYGDEDLKQNRNTYVEELGADVIDWIEGGQTGPVPDRAKRLMKSLASKGLQSMSNTQLVRIVSDLKNLRREGRTMKALQEAQRRERFERDTKSIAATIAANAKQKPQSRADVAFNPEREKREGMVKTTGNLEYDLTDSERIIQKLAGEKGRSLFKRTVFDPLYAADTEKKRGIKSALKWYQDAHRDPDTGKQVSMAEVRRPFINLVMESRDGDGELKTIEKPVTIAYLMKMYAHSQNPSQREHLIWTLMEPSKKASKTDRMAENDLKRAVAEATIDKAVAALPEKYKDMVRKSWKHFDEEQWQRINKVFSEEHGIDMPKEKFYFPIKGLQLEREGAGIEADLLARAGMKAGVSKGFTMGRVNSTAALGSSDYFDDLTSNMLQTEHYIAFSKPIREVSRVLNQVDVRRAIKAYSEPAWTAIDDWVKAMAYGRMNYGTKNSQYDKWIRRLRNNYSVFQLGLKPLTVALQTVSWFKGLSGVGKVQALASFARFARNPAQFNRGINEKSAQQESRMQNYEQGIQEAIEDNMRQTAVGDLKTRQAVAEALRQAVMAPMGWVDKGVSNLIWDAKYHESLDAGKSEADAIYDADELVRKTQSGGGILASNQFMRGSELQRMFTQFQSDPMKTANMMLEFKNHFDEMAPTEKMNTVMFGVIAPALAVYAIRNLRWPWEEPEEVAKEAERSIVSGIPFVGAIFDAIATFGLDQVKKARGLPVDKSAYNYIADMDAPLLSPMANIGGGILKGDLGKLAEGVGGMAGLPAGFQIIRTIENADIAIKQGNAKYLILSKKAVNKEFDDVARMMHSRPSATNKISYVKKMHENAQEILESWTPEKKAAFIEYQKTNAQMKAEQRKPPK